MATETWADLYGEAMEHYQAARFVEAFDLLTHVGERFPDQEAVALYLRSCLATRLGNNDMSIDLLETSLGKGHWYGEQVMRESPSWSVLQGIPRFEAMVEVCKSRQAASKAEPRVLFSTPDGGCNDYPCSLFIALHGNADYAHRALNAWGAFTDDGWLLAAVQSSQAMTSTLSVWDDQDIALLELGEHYSAIKQQYNIDEDKVIIAGFSMGGETALRAALTGTVPAKGFVLLGPGGPTIDNPQDWLPLIERKSHDLRGYVLMGESDQAIEQDAVRSLVTLLNEQGIPCELEVVPGIAHDYPPDARQYVNRALAFISPTRAT